MQDQDGAPPIEEEQPDSPPETGDKPAAQPEPPKVDPVQKRIDKLTAEKYHFARQVDKLLTEVESLRAKVDKPQEPPKEVKREQFQSDEEYARHLIRQEAKAEAQREIEQERQRNAEMRARQETQQRLATFESELKKAAAKYEDFDEVVRAPENAFFNGSLLDALTDLGAVGAEIAYHLGKHPDEGWRLSNLKPVALGRELSKLEAQFSEPVKSNAPRPIKPLSGAGGSPRSDEPSDKDSPEEWLRKRQAQLRARYKAAMG